MPALRLALLLLFLYGCSESAAPSLATSADTSVEAVGATNMLQIALRGEPGTMDPHQGSLVIESIVTGDLFLGLVDVNASGEIGPGVAKHWRVSDDGLTWTFDLYENMAWSDGKPIDANDFLYSLRRFVAPGTASRQPFLLDSIVNAAAITAGEMPVETLGVHVSPGNPYQLTIHLHRPELSLLNILLGARAGYPLPAHVIDAYPDDWTSPEHWVSNGAYVLVDWRPLEYLELAANPNFPQAPAIKRFRYLPTASPQVAYNRFRNGEIHASTNLPAGETETARRDYPQEFRSSNMLVNEYLVFNVTRPPFNDVNLRRALAMAVDPQLITQKVLTWGYQPSMSIVPQWVADYEAAVVPHNNTALEERRVESRRLLADAGFSTSNPLQVTLRYIDAGIERKKATVAIMGLWKAIGVDVKLQQSELKVHYSDLSARNFDVAYAGFGGGSAPTGFLFEYSTDDPTTNLSGYTSKAFLEPYNQALSQPNLSQRNALLRQAESIILNDYPVVPLFTPVQRRLVSAKLQGWEDNVLDIHRVRYLSWKMSPQ